MSDDPPPDHLRHRKRILVVQKLQRIEIGMTTGGHLLKGIQLMKMPYGSASADVGDGTEMCCCRNWKKYANQDEICLLLRGVGCGVLIETTNGQIQLVRGIEIIRQIEGDCASRQP